MRGRVQKISRKSDYFCSFNIFKENLWSRNRSQNFISYKVTKYRLTNLVNPCSFSPAAIQYKIFLQPSADSRLTSDQCPTTGWYSLLSSGGQVTERLHSSSRSRACYSLDQYLEAASEKEAHISTQSKAPCNYSLPLKRVSRLFS